MTQTLEYLDRLIAYPTISSESNLSMISYLYDFLQCRGFEVHQIDDPDEAKAGLFASIGPKGGGGILLSGHTDVVPTQGQHWSRPDFKLTREGDRIYGRGTTDMKGYLASMLYAADTASRAELKRPLKLALSYDEEIGCVGISQMINHLESSIGLPDMAIIGEPTSMQVAIGHKGKSAIEAICHGQSGHSALAPQFVSALHMATDLVSSLRTLQNELAQSGARDEAYSVPYSTIHVGKLFSGVALNMVPEEALINFEVRHLPADSNSKLMTRITHLADKVAANYQTQFPAAAIELNLYNSYPGLDVANSASVITDVQQFSRTTNTAKVAFGTEAGYFDKLGIPTVVCGPGSMAGQGHQPDEYLSLEQLECCDKMMERIVKSLT